MLKRAARLKINTVIVLRNLIEAFVYHNRAAKRLLSEIVEKGRPSPAFHHNDGPGMSVQEIMVPASKAGLVIGKGGETIKQLQVRLSFLLNCNGFLHFIDISEMHLTVKYNY